MGFIFGTVKFKGHVLSGVRVDAIVKGTNTLSKRVHSDSRGYYYITIDPGDYTMKFYGRGVDSTIWYDITVPGAGGTDQPARDAIAQLINNGSWPVSSVPSGRRLYDITESSSVGGVYYIKDRKIRTDTAIFSRAGINALPKKYSDFESEIALYTNGLTGGELTYTTGNLLQGSKKLSLSTAGGQIGGWEFRLAKTSSGSEWTCPLPNTSKTSGSKFFFTFWARVQDGHSVDQEFLVDITVNGGTSSTDNYIKAEFKDNKWYRYQIEFFTTSGSDCRIRFHDLGGLTGNACYVDFDCMMLESVPDTNITEPSIWVTGTSLSEALPPGSLDQSIIKFSASGGNHLTTLDGTTQNPVVLDTILDGARPTYVRIKATEVNSNSGVYDGTIHRLQAGHGGAYINASAIYYEGAGPLVFKNGAEATSFNLNGALWVGSGATINSLTSLTGDVYMSDTKILSHNGSTIITGGSLIGTNRVVTSSVADNNITRAKLGFYGLIGNLMPASYADFESQPPIVDDCGSVLTGVYGTTGGLIGKTYLNIDFASSPEIYFTDSSFAKNIHFPVASGRYIIHFWARTNYKTSDVSFRVRLQFQNSTNVSQIFTVPTYVQSWLQYSYAFTAPTGATDAYITIDDPNISEGIVQFDCFMVEYSPTGYSEVSPWVPGYDDMPGANGPNLIYRDSATGKFRTVSAPSTEIDLVLASGKNLIYNGTNVTNSGLIAANRVVTTSILDGNVTPIKTGYTQQGGANLLPARYGDFKPAPALYALSGGYSYVSDSNNLYSGGTRLRLGTGSGTYDIQLCSGASDYPIANGGILVGRYLIISFWAKAVTTTTTLRVSLSFSSMGEYGTQNVSVTTGWQYFRVNLYVDEIGTNEPVRIGFANPSNSNRVDVDLIKVELGEDDTTHVYPTTWSPGLDRTAYISDNELANGNIIYYDVDGLLTIGNGTYVIDFASGGWDGGCVTGLYTNAGIVEGVDTLFQIGTGNVQRHNGAGAFADVAVNFGNTVKLATNKEFVDGAGNPIIRYDTGYAQQFVGNLRTDLDSLFYNSKTGVNLQPKRYSDFETSPTIPTTGCTASYQSSNIYHSKALKISGMSSNWIFHLAETTGTYPGTLPVTVDDGSGHRQIIVSLFSMSVAGGFTMWCRVYWGGSATPYTDTAYPGVGADAKEWSRTWSTPITVPDDATSFRVAFYDGGATFDTIYIDNVMVEIISNKNLRQPSQYVTLDLTTAISSAAIIDGAVTNSKLCAAAVTGDKVTDYTLAPTKLQTAWRGVNLMPCSYTDFENTKLGVYITATTPAFDNTNQYEGAYCLKLGDGVNNWRAKLAATDSTYNIVTPVLSAKYIFSFFAKVPSGSVTDITFNIKDSTGNVVGTLTPKIETTWIRWYKDFVMSANNKCVFEISAPSNARIVFIDCPMVEYVEDSFTIPSPWVRGWPDPGSVVNANLDQTITYLNSSALKCLDSTAITLNHIADGASYRRTGTSYVDSSNRVFSVYNGSAATNCNTLFYDGSSGTIYKANAAVTSLGIKAASTKFFASNATREVMRYEVSSSLPVFAMKANDANNRDTMIISEAGAGSDIVTLTFKGNDASGYSLLSMGHNTNVRCFLAFKNNNNREMVRVETDANSQGAVLVYGDSGSEQVAAFSAGANSSGKTVVKVLYGTTILVQSDTSNTLRVNDTGGSQALNVDGGGRVSFNSLSSGGVVLPGSAPSSSLVGGLVYWDDANNYLYVYRGTATAGWKRVLLS